MNAGRGQRRAAAANGAAAAAKLTAAVRPGQLVRLSPLVQRLTADNAGPMTGPGTNTYLVGRSRIAVIDPGPADPVHVERILAACEGRLGWILATHSHPDHSPGAAALAAASGAPVYGNAIADDGRQDLSFQPQRGFVHDERLPGADFTLRALHTPGHVANHLCYLLEEEGLLFTGDHLMADTTVVIVPPHGDMKDYLDSLRLLSGYPVRAMAPGHGRAMVDATAEITRVIAHRLRREEKVMAALRDTPVPLQTLLLQVYDDVPFALHSLASHSLLAHLLKLQRDGRVVEQPTGWRTVSSH